MAGLSFGVGVFLLKGENVEKPNYYAIIPANVRYSKISASAKLLYGEITALSNKNGYCHAWNKYFAELYDKSNGTISRWIKELEQGNFITVELDIDNNTKQVLQRRLYIHEMKGGPYKNDGRGTRKNEGTPPRKNLEGINTSVNNTRYNIVESAGVPAKWTELHKQIEDSCLSQIADSSQYVYGKERKHVRELANKFETHDDPEEFAIAFFNTFYSLKKANTKFWRGQPFLPSILNSGSIYPRIIEEMKNGQSSYQPTGAEVTF